MARRQGTMEAGDIYVQDPSQIDGRGDVIGRLVVDLDNNYFYQRSEGRTAKRLSYDTVMWLVANDLVEFDHDDTRNFLIDYMIRLDTKKKEVREAEMKRLAKDRQIKVMDADKKLVRKTRRRATIAKIVWSLGCIILMIAAFRASIPEPDAQPGEPTMAGEGITYSESNDLFQDASYLVALGNGQSLFGLIYDNETREVGEQNSTDVSIKENVLFNAAVSQKYPLHMRPLYYDRTNFYQSSLKKDDAQQGSMAVYIQNPSGMALGVAQNELVLCGGAGMGSIAIASPSAYQEPTPQQVAQSIEARQRDLIKDNTTGDYSQSKYATTLPDGWLGFDSCDIDDKQIAASYWYTKNSTGKQSDLRRRVAVFNVESVYDKAASGVSDVKAVLLNYQDEENNFYNPVISVSPASNRVHHWLGYMKQATDGATGFFIRKYEDAEDIMLENLSNTFSTPDLTGIADPITNYTLYNDYLFYEQRGFIWVLDLSQIVVEPDELTHTKTVKRVNPIQICRATDIRPSTTRDDIHLYGSNAVPVSQYQVMTLTTEEGVETGIAFIEADTGNLVFQPIRGTAVAAAVVNLGAGANTGSVNEVSSGDATAVLEADLLNEAKNAEREARKNKNNEEPRALTQTPVDTGNTGTVGNGADSVDSSGRTTHSDAVNRLYGSNAVTATDVTTQSAEEKNLAENKAGRILIRAGANNGVRIVCFAVRGEQFFWIEEDGVNGNGKRSMRVSPVYYKNDAVQITESDDSQSDAETNINASSNDQTVATTDSSSLGQTSGATAQSLTQTSQNQGSGGASGAPTGITDSIG